MAISGVMPIREPFMAIATLPRRLMPVATLVAAGFFMAAPARSDAPPAADRFAYCTGCLCEDTAPPMAISGDWRPNGQMIGNRIVLKFVPREAGIRLAAGCGRRTPG